MSRSCTHWWNGSKKSIVSRWYHTAKLSVANQDVRVQTSRRRWSQMTTLLVFLSRCFHSYNFYCFLLRQFFVIYGKLIPSVSFTSLTFKQMCHRDVQHLLATCLTDRHIKRDKWSLTMNLFLVFYFSDRTKFWHQMNVTQWMNSFSVVHHSLSFFYLHWR